MTETSILTRNSQWTIDPTRTRIGFHARSLWGALPVEGVFRDVTGTLSVDDAETCSGQLIIDPHSIDTSNRWRDNHLRGRQFLDVDRHDDITATGDGITVRGTHFAGEALIRAVGATFTATVGGVIERHGDDLRVRADFPLDLHDIGVATPLSFIRRHVNVTADVVLQRQQ